MVTNSSLEVISQYGAAERSVGERRSQPESSRQVESGGSEPTPEKAAVSLQASAAGKAVGAVKTETKLELSEEAAKEVASRLEKALNEAHGTQVRFNVAHRERGSNSFSFKVIEKETGEVVREFPAESVRKLAESASFDSGEGVFVDEPA